MKKNARIIERESKNARVFGGNNFLGNKRCKYAAVEIVRKGMSQ